MEKIFQISTNKFHSKFKNNHLQAIMKQKGSLKMILYYEWQGGTKGGEG